MDTILVTGTGGGVGQSILKSLDATDYKIIAADSEPLAAGLYFKNLWDSVVIPYANQPDYIPALLDLCKKERVNLLFPGHDIELLPLAKNKELFNESGTTCIVSSSDIIELCDDKLATARFLQDNNYPFPITEQFHEHYWFTKPVILKPQRGGARSRNTYIASTLKEWIRALGVIDKNNCVIQEYIEGPEEYTCSVVCLDNQLYGPILMRRILRDGDTYKAFVEKNGYIESFIKSVVQTLNDSFYNGVLGAINIQLRLQDNIPVIFEINARCSGTTAARTLAGFNEPKMIADYIQHGEKPVYDIKELTILRYWQEVAIETTL